MKKIITHVLALGVGIIPISGSLIIQPAQGQISTSPAQQAQRLLKQARQQSQQQQYSQAIQTLQQVLAISQQIHDLNLQATALVWLGFNFDALGQKPSALKYYNQALPLFRAVGDRAGEATTLNNIGLVQHGVS